MSRPSLPPPPHAGACLCGQVRYSYEARPLALNACYCADCKKLSGATHIHMLIGAREAFKHEAGDVQRWRKRAQSGREIDIVRCVTCGTRLWHEPLAAAHLVFIAAGTLDDPSWFKPASHIWIERAPDGQDFGEDTLRIAGQPADRAQLMDAFNKLYSE